MSWYMPGLNNVLWKHRQCFVLYLCCVMCCYASLFSILPVSFLCHHFWKGKLELQNDKSCIMIITNETNNHDCMTRFWVFVVLGIQAFGVKSPSINILVHFLIILNLCQFITQCRMYLEVVCFMKCWIVHNVITFHGPY